MKAPVPVLDTSAPAWMQAYAADLDAFVRSVLARIDLLDKTCADLEQRLAELEEEA